MAPSTRRAGVWLLALLLVVTVLTAPALAHEGHDSHGDESGSGLSVWPFFLVLGTVTAGGSLLAGYVWDVPRQHAVGLGAGGATMAAIAAIAYLL